MPVQVLKKRPTRATFFLNSVAQHQNNFFLFLSKIHMFTGLKILWEIDKKNCYNQKTNEQTNKLTPQTPRISGQDL